MAIPENNSKEFFDSHRKGSEKFFLKRRWSEKDTAFLKKLVENGITNPSYIVSQRWFENRSRNAITSQIKHIQMLEEFQSEMEHE